MQVEDLLTLGRANGLLHAYLAAPWSKQVPDAVDAAAGSALAIGHIAPTYVLSTAPFSDASHQPSRISDYALALHDQQVVILPAFHDFPATQVTLELWMLSTDACRKGVPFSYSTGVYSENDNSFLLFDCNNWGIAVMEDEGLLSDHGAGFSSTDGQWHHIAVTWDSSSGQALLYDNGRLMWSVKRAQGASIPSGGTLVIGREQDCVGGCFDSDAGATGSAKMQTELEYGSQDFYGVIDQMRLWGRVLSADKVRENFRADLQRFSAPSDTASKATGMRDNSEGLVAFWKFNEGRGFEIADATGHGHTLYVTSTPTWLPVGWSFRCGDGQLQGAEECDDGNTRNGDGCSSECRVESGWHCTATSPSTCSRNSQAQPVSNIAGSLAGLPGRSDHASIGTAFEHRSDSFSHSASGRSFSTSRSAARGGGLWPWLTGSAVLSVVGVLLYAFRKDLVEAYPRAWAALKQTASNVRTEPLQGLLRRLGFGNVHGTYRTIELEPCDEFVLPDVLQRDHPPYVALASSSSPHRDGRNDSAQDDSYDEGPLGP